MSGRLAVLGLIVSLLVLMTAACGQDADPGAAPAEPAPTEATEPASPEPAQPEPPDPVETPQPVEPPEPPAPAASPAPSEPATPTGDVQTSLLVLQPGIAPSLDPDSSNNAAPELQEAHLNLLEPLVDYPLVDNGQGVLEPRYNVRPPEFEPRLATSWTSVENDDGTITWTFDLRQGVTSCAGNTFSADDVVYTWARAKSLSGDSPVTWFLLGNVPAIFGLEVFQDDPATRELSDTELRKIDDLTVEFTQLNANELFPRVLAITFAGIFDSADMLAHATEDDPWSHQYTETENAPGFGAYCLTSWNRNEEMTLTANPDYYRGQPQFQTVTIRKVPRSANRVGSIISGEADIVTALTPMEVANLGGQRTVDILGWINNKGLSIGLSFNVEPWSLPSNEKLRQAVAFALPYEEIIDEDFGGDAQQWTGNIASRYFGYLDQPIYETDTKRAQELVDEFLEDNELESLEDFTDGFELVYMSERADVLKPIAERIKTALEEIGIDVKLKALSNATYTDRTLVDFDAPMFLQDHERPVAPDVSYSSQVFFLSKDSGGVNVPSAYDNPDFDSLHLEQAQTAGTARLPILDEMQEILMSELPHVPIAEPRSSIAVKTGVVNCWAGQPFDLLNFWYFRTTSDCQSVADSAVVSAGS